MIAARQQINIIEQLIGMVILSINAAATCFEAHIDVFGNQNDATIGVAIL